MDTCELIDRFGSVECKICKETLPNHPRIVIKHFLAQDDMDHEYALQDFVWMNCEVD